MIPPCGTLPAEAKIKSWHKQHVGGIMLTQSSMTSKLSPVSKLLSCPQDMPVAFRTALYGKAFILTAGKSWQKSLLE